MKQEIILLGLCVLASLLVSSEGYTITKLDENSVYSDALDPTWDYEDLTIPPVNTTTTTTTTSTTPSTTTSTTSSTTTPVPPSPVADCEISKVVVYHFPGPCKAAITCKNGSQFTVDQCLNTLTFISQFNPKA